MKTAIMSFGLLVGILGYCAWLNSNDLQRQIERQPKIAPNIVHKVKPPVADDELNVVNNPQLLAAIREADKAIPLKGAAL
jgi:hypothetical protein